MNGLVLSDRYRVVRELGRGGMGVVYLAHDVFLDRDVAVKVVSPLLLAPEDRERFRREARLVARLDHPAIVGVHDIGEHGGSLFLVMPYVPGSSLASLLHGGQLELGELLDIAVQVAEALDYSHEKGIVHRDIKPENILVSREGAAPRVRITDFGIAISAHDRRLTRSGILLGTATHFSPEYVLGTEVDGRSDIYSMGVILFQALAGQPPFVGGDVATLLARIAQEDPPRLRDRVADVDERLDAIVTSCLAKEPWKRPGSALELARLLRDYAVGLPQGLRTRKLERRSEATRVLSAARPSPALLVGRDAELAELAHRLAAALSGEAQLVLLGGDAGTGKTRLLEALEELAWEVRAVVVHGRCVAGVEGFPYHAFCEAILERVRALAKGAGSGPKPAPAELAALLPLLRRAFPALADLPLLDSREPVREGEPPEGRAGLLDLLSRSFEALSAGAPLVLLLEELHASEPTAEALRYLVRSLANQPLLLVATYRTSSAGRQHAISRLVEELQCDPVFAHVAVAPLDTESHRRYVGTLLSGAVDDALAGALYEVTDGNPYFTKELTRSLIEAGALGEDAGTWTLLQKERLVLPATVQKAVQARLDRLPEDLHATLAAASVLGRRFSRSELRMVSAAPELTQLTGRLVAEGFLVEDAGGERLSFASGAVRDALHGSLPRRRRRLLHRQVAEALEQGSDRLDAVLPRIVGHYAEADMPEKVVPLGLSLARAAVQAFSSETAAEAARRVLEFLDPDDATAEEGEARALLADALRLEGELSSALAELDRAAAIHERRGDRHGALAVALRAAETAWEGRSVEVAARHAERGRALARALGESDALRRLLSLGATLASLGGQHERAQELLHEARANATAASEAVPRGGRLAVGLAIAVKAVLPWEIRLHEEQEILGNVYETLLAADGHDNVVPALCERWEARGERMFHLRLRSGALWHDGRRVTAYQVKRSIEECVRKSGVVPSAFGVLLGMAALRSGAAAELAGARVVDERTLELELEEPLPAYPRYLTHVGTAIARADAGEMPQGTGPFRLASFRPGRISLDAHPQHWNGQPPLAGLDFHAGLSVPSMIAELDAGTLDVASELPPATLEEVLADRRFGATLVETPRRGLYFALFRAGSDACPPELRRAVAREVRRAELVARTLGRFGKPAEGLFPPGILGPARRRERAAAGGDEARAPRFDPPRVLRAAIHPVLRERYPSFTAELLRTLHDLGVELADETPTMTSYLRSVAGASVDLVLGRWHANYNDPGSFTHDLFHSEHGVFGRFASSPALDELLRLARSEARPDLRDERYRRIEAHLLGDDRLVPLFHAVDFRLVGRRVRGVRLLALPPYLDYAALGKEVPASSGPAVVSRGGVLRIPVRGTIDSLDPAGPRTAAHAKVIPAVFEPLTRQREGVIQPWLARVEPDDDGQVYRCVLDRDARFHDGRPVTSADVRYSLERLLRCGDRLSRRRLSPIVGARALSAGEVDTLVGFAARSASEFTVRLEEPLPLFPALLSSPSTALVPDGAERFRGTWNDGCVGTGPYRVTAFEPGRALELEANPHYFRQGLPRNDRLVFTFGVSAEESLEGFHAGRFSLIGDLAPDAVDALRRDPSLSERRRVVPRLGTHFVVFNAKKGPLANPLVRRLLIRGLDAGSLVRRSVGRLATPALGVIPPGLLGHEPSAPRRPRDAPDLTLPTPLRIRVALATAYRGPYAALAEAILGSLRSRGMQVEVLEAAAEDLPAEDDPPADLALYRYAADYPDTDGLLRDLFHTRDGLLGLWVGSEQLDWLIERGRLGTDPPSRHTSYRKAEELLARDALILPLFHEEAYRFARPEVEGLELNLMSPVVAYEKLWVRAAAPAATAAA